MRIYAVNPINFTARKTSAVKPETKQPEKFTKDHFYDQIDGFLNNKYGKEKYFKMFSDGVDKIFKQQDIAEYTPVERKYISNLVSMLDMSDKLKNIPDQYLRKNMQELLAHKK